eukprot:5485103-Prymnesium_polylepis.1
MSEPRLPRPRNSRARRQRSDDNRKQARDASALHPPPTLDKTHDYRRDPTRQHGTGVSAEQGSIITGPSYTRCTGATRVPASCQHPLSRSVKMAGQAAEMAGQGREDAGEVSARGWFLVVSQRRMPRGSACGDVG